MTLIVGAGKLGLHLVRALLERGAGPLQVLSPSGKKASVPDSKEVEWFASTAGLDPRPRICVLCVPDAAIADAARTLADALEPGTPVAHTSGTVSAKELAPFFAHHGVCYPLQTFTPGRPVDWSQVPLLVQGSDPEALEIFTEFARTLGGRIVDSDDERRAALHLAAVFANNFTNHFFSIAHQICTEAGLDFRLLLPLVEATVEKIRHIPPLEAQTGPVVRGDLPTIARHLERLKAHPEWAELYRAVSDDIARMRQEQRKGP